ncbi:MAG: hypothetical protein PF450_11525 [Bacteroidales bacterium]|jgi:hypothetical protein|nr:hypothetical protein [Bacteroidales bacterium]
MSITPLYTIDEINAKIEKAKKNLEAAEEILSYSRQGGQMQVQRERVDVLRHQLEWYQRQRMSLEGVTGPQSVCGRVYRG